MFGVGPQEMVLIGLLLLVVFGPGKLPSMARDFGRFVSEARLYIDEYKSELVSSVEDESPEQEKTFELAIQEGEMTPAKISVDEGDQVNLRVTSDSSIEFHLHGYGFFAEVEPGDVGELSFYAAISGRFEIENHDSYPHEVLGELLVQPR
jgi:Sec-independent protein translocase protein TatA